MHSDNPSIGWDMMIEWFLCSALKLDLCVPCFNCYLLKPTRFKDDLLELHELEWVHDDYIILICRLLTLTLKTVFFLTNKNKTS